MTAPEKPGTADAPLPGSADGPAAARRALVLGGTGYVGAAVLRALAAAGVSAAFTYRRSRDRARELEALGHWGYAIDLRDPVAVAALVHRAHAEHGPFTALLHCAAASDVSELCDIDDALWDDILNTNVRAAFVACRELVPLMAAAGGGDIAFAVGPDAIGTAPSSPHFAASQAALAGFVRASARTLGPRGIRINAVALGMLEAGSSSLLSADRREDATRYSALRRAGTADEAARVIVRLALANRYVHGAIVPVTGGL